MVEPPRLPVKHIQKGYGEIWFDELAIIKILALKNVKRKFRVNYDSNNDVVFTVQE